MAASGAASWPQACVQRSHGRLQGGGLRFHGGAGLGLALGAAFGFGLVAQAGDFLAHAAGDVGLLRGDGGGVLAEHGLHEGFAAAAGDEAHGSASLSCMDCSAWASSAPRRPKSGVTSAKAARTSKSDEDGAQGPGAEAGDVELRGFVLRGP